MAKVHPFHGLRFNTQFAPNLASVLCPPYDVISPQERHSCYERSPFNIIRLEDGEVGLGDGTGNNRYTRAAATLKQWYETGVLVAEAQPALYLHHQLFQGKQRRGLVARVGLKSRDFRPHENTQPQPKEDRLELLKACGANISPILALYHDPSGEIISLLTSVEESPPLLDVTGEHRLWAITEPQLLARIQQLFSPLPLYIADGHHRYETALAYLKQNPQLPGAGMVMATLVEVHDPGLVILPVHRMVRGLSQKALSRLRERGEDYFEFRPLPSLEELLRALQEADNQQLGLFLRGEFFLLVSRQTQLETDIVLLHRLVLEGILGLDSPSSQLSYTVKAEEAVNRVVRGEYQLAFLVHSLGVDRLQKIADKGERLPGKATYFYPKLPTGLVLNLLRL